MENFEKIKILSLKLLIDQGKNKEYNCHIKFVAQIAKQLGEKYELDYELLYIAGLLHDIGRDQELPGEEHEVAGGRIAYQFLTEIGVADFDKQCVVGCVVNHSNYSDKKNIYEKVIMTADSASKILYHQAFMLMCKKETYEERAKWGIKYLEKGLKGIQFEDYRQDIVPYHDSYMELYKKVLVSDM